MAWRDRLPYSARTPRAMVSAGAWGCLARQPRTAWRAMATRRPAARSSGTTAASGLTRLLTMHGYLPDFSGINQEIDYFNWNRIRRCYAATARRLPGKAPDKP